MRVALASVHELFLLSFLLVFLLRFPPCRPSALSLEVLLHQELEQEVPLQQELEQQAPRLALEQVLQILLLQLEQLLLFLLSQLFLFSSSSFPSSLLTTKYTQCILLKI